MDKELDIKQEINQGKTQEEMVKEAVEEAKKQAMEAEADAAGENPESDQVEETVGEEQETSDGEEGMAPGDGQETPDSDEGKFSFFKKKKKKDPKDERIEELTDKLTRQMAEFDNFRKRTEKEKSQMYEIGAKDIIEKILPVVDNFERGLAAVTEEEKENSFVQGMDKIYKQLMTTLEGIGVKPIEAVGKEFNPDFHNAVMHEENEEYGENIVTQEFQKGYMYRDSVVRHSMVKVAN